MLLVPAYAVVVAAPAGPDQGCPSPHQITDALMARIPAVVVPAYEASTPGVLRLSVSGGGPNVPLRIELTDPGGEDRLYRNLTLAERGRGNECPVLADTVALIVERFLKDLGYEAPPSPPPVVIRPSDNLPRGPPETVRPSDGRFDLLAGGAWRGASMPEADFEAGIGAGFERTIGRRRLAATFSMGVSSQRGSELSDGSKGTLRRIPLRLGLLFPFAAGPGWLEPGVRFGVDWLFSAVTWSDRSESHRRVSPGAEAVLGYRIGLVRRLFARLSASMGVGVPYQFLAQPPNVTDPTRLFGEPRFYAKSGLELGFSFQ